MAKKIKIKIEKNTRNIASISTLPECLIGIPHAKRDVRLEGLGAGVRLADGVRRQLEPLVLFALAQALLGQGAKLVALAPDQLLGGQLEVADEPADHSVAAGILHADLPGVGATQSAKTRPMGYLVLDHSVIYEDIGKYKIHDNAWKMVQQEFHNEVKCAY